MDEETKLFYNLTAEKTADEWYENFVLMPSIEEFVALLQEKPRVLDLGCGGGYESMRLTKASAQVLGVDFSEESIRIAKDRLPPGSAIRIDGLQATRWGKIGEIRWHLRLRIADPHQPAGVAGPVRADTWRLERERICDRHGS